MKILVLYMELADYTVECLRALKKTHPVAEIHVVAYPVNAEAPFKFDFSNIGRLYTREKFDHEKLQLFSDKLVPDLIICSGWTDRSYLKVIRTWSNKAATVLCMDNMWHGTFKQQVAAVFARFYLPRVFKYIWIPFNEHKKFAQRMGFKNERVKTGFYSADVQKFNAIFESCRDQKEVKFPKIFICVARYIPQKNLRMLWDAFIELDNENELDWELWNLGKGDGFNSKTIHPKIKHHGFVQPKDMPRVIKDSGVFVLPSLFEPWGVVVHEFAASGFPLLVSNHVGAQSAFLESGENGFVFSPTDKEELKQKMRKIMALPNSALLEMADKSASFSKKITHEKWVEQCVNFMK